MSPSPGKLIIVTAPSGAGKTTIVKHLLKTFDRLDFSTSVTTRNKRPHEVEGKDYFFKSEEEFRKLITEEAFAEWEEVYQGQLYGTLKSEIEERGKSGKHVVFDIDVQGAMSLRKTYPDASMTIFIKTPSMDVLESRLRNRKTETEDKIQRRLNKAREEIKLAYTFDKVLINDKLEEALKEAEMIVSNFIDN